MRIGYFDCIAGASGDMILAAMIDAGLPLDRLRARLAGLRLSEFEIEASRVSKSGFGATHVDVRISHHVHARSLSDIKALIAESDLSPQVKDAATTIFHRIGEVEAGIHGTAIDDVHLHELGGTDTIVDVVGALVGLEELGIERVEASPLPLARGFVKGAHGSIPLPAPATMGLLEGIPIVSSPVEGETVTPTGAALMSSLASTFGTLPAMTLERVGYGAGTRDLPIPNLLRLVIGRGVSANQVDTETVTLLETNIDDLNPEVYDHVMNLLFSAGALDVMLQPVQMKKNRPATMIRVICQPSLADALTHILLLETSTLGVRRQNMERRCLPRQHRSVETPYGAVRVKVACWGSEALRAKPEYDDCRQLAEQHQVPLSTIYAAVDRAMDDTEAFPNPCQ
jgi:pyridinium-3,5-bisthiocarboxylic acid mononucleotide nickel chelatase